MGPTSRFLDYAQGFELTFDDDDWSRLERHFAPDAVYEVRNMSFACRIAGREAIFRGLKKSLDGFDRKLPKRSIEVTDPPTEDGDSMTVGWVVTYEKAGAPPFKLRGRSTARYRGEVIVELVDEFPDGMSDEAERWVRDHAPELDASYV
jgi:hypothetical protein